MKEGKKKHKEKLNSPKKVWQILKVTFQNIGPLGRCFEKSHSEFAIPSLDYSTFFSLLLFFLLFNQRLALAGNPSLKKNGTKTKQYLIRPEGILED